MFVIGKYFKLSQSKAKIYTSGAQLNTESKLLPLLPNNRLSSKSLAVTSNLANAPGASMEKERHLCIKFGSFQ